VLASGTKAGCRVSSDGGGFCGYREIPLKDRAVGADNFVGGKVWLFAESRGLGAQKNVMQGDDADDFGVGINDWEAAYVAVAHDTKGIVKVVIGRASEQHVVHDFGDGDAAGKDVASAKSDTDVAIRKHGANFAGGIKNRKKTAVSFPHQFSSRTKIGVQVASVGRSHHYIVYFHRNSPSPEIMNLTVKLRGLAAG